MIYYNILYGKYINICVFMFEAEDAAGGAAAAKAGAVKLDVQRSRRG